MSEQTGTELRASYETIGITGNRVVGEREEAGITTP